MFLAGSRIIYIPFPNPNQMFFVHKHRKSNLNKLQHKETFGFDLSVVLQKRTRLTFILAIG